MLVPNLGFLDGQQSQRSVRCLLLNEVLCNQRVNFTAQPEFFIGSNLLICGFAIANLIPLALVRGYR